MSDRIRVLLAKPTHDCHDRGVRYLARKLRDGGFEVIFANFLLADEVVSMALQEDVDAIGVSSSSGGHMAVFEDLLKGLSEQGAGDMLVLGGGIIPQDDAEELARMGVAQVFGPGTSHEQVMQFIRDRVGERRAAAAP